MGPFRLLKMIMMINTYSTYLLKVFCLHLIDEKLLSQAICYATKCYLSCTCCVTSAFIGLLEQQMLRIKYDKVCFYRKIITDGCYNYQLQRWFFCNLKTVRFFFFLECYEISIYKVSSWYWLHYIGFSHSITSHSISLLSV